jgi:hypothetical protein
MVRKPAIPFVSVMIAALASAGSFDYCFAELAPLSKPRTWSFTVK